MKKLLPHFLNSYWIKLPINRLVYLNRKILISNHYHHTFFYLKIMALIFYSSFVIKRRITIKWIHYRGTRLEIFYCSKKEGEGGHMGSQELKKGDLLRVKMGQMGSSMSDVEEKITYHCVNELIRSHQILYQRA